MCMYATFRRRFQAMLIDGAVVSSALVAMMLLLDASSPATSIQLTAWAVFFVAALMYEPIQVAWWQGTVGHRALNLRVRGPDGRPLSLGKATVRSLLKAVLGVAAFAVMPTNARNQALHDLVFDTTVEMRWPRGAGPTEFIAERRPPSSARSVRWRRVQLAFAYLMLLWAGLGLAAVVAVSSACLHIDRCTTAESQWVEVMGLVNVGASCAVSILGWFGLLPGSRR